MEEDVPHYFLCPISQEIMQDPVIDPEGNSYDRVAITRWLARDQTSPVTRSPLRPNQLKPNRALKEAIEEYQSRVARGVDPQLGVPNNDARNNNNDNIDGNNNNNNNEMALAISAVASQTVRFNCSHCRIVVDRGNRAPNGCHLGSYRFKQYEFHGPAGYALGLCANCNQLPHSHFEHEGNLYCFAFCCQCAVEHEVWSNGRFGREACGACRARTNQAMNNPVRFQCIRCGIQVDRSLSHPSRCSQGSYRYNRYKAGADGNCSACHKTLAQHFQYTGDAFCYPWCCKCVLAEGKWEASRFNSEACPTCRACCRRLVASQPPASAAPTSSRSAPAISAAAASSSGQSVEEPMPRPPSCGTCVIA